MQGRRISASQWPDGFVDRTLAQEGQDILVEDERKDRMRGLLALLEAERAMDTSCTPPRTCSQWRTGRRRVSACGVCAD